MNICFLGGFTAGGTESATFLVANQLSKIQDTKIFILSTGFNHPTFNLDRSIDFSSVKSRGLASRNLEIFRYLRSNKIDILVLVQAMTGIFGLIPSKLCRCKTVVWEHANYYQTQSSKHIYKMRGIEFWLADNYVVLTKRDLNNFETHFKCKSKISQIYNISETVSSFNYNHKSKIIISAGHIVKIKNFIAIPKIAKKVFSEFPDWEWHIYGDGTAETVAELQEAIDSAGLTRNVILKGRADDMSKVYCKAGIYVMTSLQEGLPMVLLEAQSYGLPLVSFDIETGPDEIIQDGRNGYLVRPYDIEEMAEKIKYLISNEQLRKDFSKNSGLNRHLFNPELIIGQWKRVLNLA